MDVNITVEEINLIMKSLDKYENLNREQAGRMSIVVSGLLKDANPFRDEETRNKMALEVKQHMYDAEQKDLEFQEKSVMIKSKLIQAKHAIIAKQSVNW
jgi:hypothetical protein